MARIELPDGNWAELRAPAELSERQRRLLRRSVPPMSALDLKMKGIRKDAAAEAGVAADDVELTDEEFVSKLSSDEMDVIYDTQCASIVAYVKEWSLGELPTLESVLDLPGPIFDELAKATFGFGDGSINPDDPKQLLDKSSPPVPSSDSVDGTRAEPLPTTESPSGSPTSNGSSTIEEPLEVA